MKNQKKKKVMPKVHTIAKIGDLILERPEGMPYEEYRALRKEQQKKMKFRLMGFMVWKSNYYSLTEGKSIWGKLEAWGTIKEPVPKLRFR